MNAPVDYFKMSHWRSLIKSADFLHVITIHIYFSETILCY